MNLIPAQVCLAFLLLCSPLWAQGFQLSVNETNPAPLTASDVIQSDLIVAPDSAPAGGTFLVSLPGNVSYKIEPMPKVMIPLKDEAGRRVLVIQAAEAPGYTVTVDHAVVHPTAAEIEAAREHKGDQAAYEKFIAEHSRDEIYRDSHTVRVGGQPPGPDPPKPPDDPLARKVFDAAVLNKLPASECQEVAGNMRAVIAQAVATDMTLEQMQQEIKKRNLPITSGKPGWDAWEKTLPSIFPAITTKEQAVQAYEKIADGLGTV